MGDRYKIGVFIDTFYPMVDGVIVGINSVVKFLNRAADVTVFTVAPLDGDYDDEGLGYRVVRCRSAKVPFAKVDYVMPLPARDKAFLKALEASKLDLVHICSPFGVGQAGLKYARRHKIPAVVTLHSQYKKDFYRHTHSKLLTAFLMKGVSRILRGCDECWSVNEPSKKVLYEYGAKTEPIVIENGADMVPVTDKNKARDKIKAHCGIVGSQKILLYVGRIVALKNVFFIADALKLLKGRGLDFKIVFIGDGADKEALSKKFDSYGLSDNVYFAGLVYDRDFIAAAYAAADLFLFPSFYDTDGVVKKEAACQRTPIVCLSGSIVAQTVLKDRNAYVSENSPQAYADEIMRALSNPGEYSEIAENAHKEIYVTWEQTAEKTLERYAALIKSKRHKALENP